MLDPRPVPGGVLDLPEIPRRPGRQCVVRIKEHALGPVQVVVFVKTWGRGIGAGDVPDAAGGSADATKLSLPGPVSINWIYPSDWYRIVTSLRPPKWPLDTVRVGWESWNQLYP